MHAASSWPRDSLPLVLILGYQFARYRSQFELYQCHIDHHLTECYVITPCEEVITVSHVYS